MPGFFSTKQIDALRKVAEVSLVDDVEIWPLTTVSNIYEDSGDVTYVYRETVKGWIFSTPNPGPTAVAGIIGTLNTYRVFLAVGTDVHPGDRLRVRDEFFELIDTVDESTWLPILRCSARRLE